jgi:hypothetical protein
MRTDLSAGDIEQAGDLAVNAAGLPPRAAGDRSVAQD